MTVQLSKKLIIGIIGMFVLIGGIILFGTTPEQVTAPQVAGVNSNIPVVSILVKAGYTPSKVTAPADKQFILRLTTKNTYDCSAALTIPALQFDQFLKPNGETDILVEPQKAGTIIEGGCSMAMYGFQLIIE